MAAGRIVLSQYFPARDRNGQLVSGALLYVYTNETTTKASIYAEEGLATPLANPVAANSSGQFPAIWASDAVTYTLSITASDGSSIGNPSVFDDYSVSTDADTASVALAEAAAVTAEAEADAAAVSAAAAAADLADMLAVVATGSDAAAIAARAAKAANGSDFANIATVRTNLAVVGTAALAASSGAELVGSIQSGTGAVAETAQAALRRVMYPEQYGAVGDGTTNDATALNAAATAAVAAGASLVLRSGKNYKVNSTVTLPAGLTVMGYGATVTVAAAITGFTASVSNITIMGVKFAGPSSTYNANSFGIRALGTANGAAVAPTFITNHRYIDCTFEDFGNAAMRLEYVDGCVIDNPICRRVGYWMILTIGTKNVTGMGGLFDTVTGYASSATDDEGGAVTWSSNEGSTDFVRYPSSENCVWFGGIAKNIPTWTAFDTHGGIGCGFVGGQVYDCRRAVWLTARTGRGPKKCFGTDITAINTFAEHAVNSNGSTKRDVAFLIFGNADTDATTRASDCHIQGTCIGYGYGGGTAAPSVVGAAQIQNAEQSCSMDVKIINPFGAGFELGSGARGTIRALIENPQSSGGSGSTVVPRYVNISATGTQTINVKWDATFIRSNAALNTYVGTRAITAGGGETLVNMIQDFKSFDWDTGIDMLVPTTLGTVRGAYPLTFTIDVVGLNGVETSPITVSRLGDMGRVSIPIISGTSDTTDFSLGAVTALPSYMRPADTRRRQVFVMDNSTNTFNGYMEISTGGVMTLYTSAASAVWTASGTKRLYDTVIQYSIV